MQCRKRLYALFCHPHAFRQCLIKIFFDLLYHRILININPALKIQLLASEIHIDGSNHSFLPIADKRL